MFHAPVFEAYHYGDMVADEIDHGPRYPDQPGTLFRPSGGRREPFFVRMVIQPEGEGASSVRLEYDVRAEDEEHAGNRARHRAGQEYPRSTVVSIGLIPEKEE